MKPMKMFLIFALIIFSNAAYAQNEDSVAKIKSELDGAGLIAQVTYNESNSTYVIVINVTDGDYMTATKNAIVAASDVIEDGPGYTIIGLIGADGTAYKLNVNNTDMWDIEYETLNGNLDASKERADRYFDSATEATPEELMTYFT